MGVDIYFSDHFKISPDVLEEYGALDISLINDLPMFVDPFLLFESDSPELNQLHEDIVRYVKYLRDLVNGPKPLSAPTVERLFYFPEVKQNWLGFSKTGNSGAGLGKAFAQSMVRSMRGALKNFGEEGISESAHIEKFALIKDGVGRDLISDFTVNLIKRYLLEYTQTFAQRHLQPSQCRTFGVNKVEFDYEKQVWTRRTFVLPVYKRDFVLLTPKAILTRDETWINRPDMLERFLDIVVAMRDTQLRQALADLLLDAVVEKRGISKSDIGELGTTLLERYPQILDEYIKLKEDNGEGAVSVSAEKVQRVEAQFILAIREIVEKLAELGFYAIPSLPNKIGANSYEEAMQRVTYLRSVIEDKDGYRIFFKDGQRSVKEDDIQIMFRLTWLGSPFDVNREVNNGRGPADFVVSRGAADKTIVEFKLGSSTSLKRNLQHQTDVYEKAGDAQRSIKVVLCLNPSEIAKVKGVLRELKREGDESVVIIDATPNKSSGSKADGSSPTTEGNAS
ncbi:hypothetical protein L1280_003092 [Deinococcus sp. HSC-46F16]|uniref:hypothetical protein n=1 Tax=Deinococcus sp. HSC-46F16 TaxID=2910968 RepID=UPI00209DB5AE|nr:hypothetical protein [Deinococcus sp. HSC-46F16]MCP2015909.1 hypothetical protein [Deinococcus sp. HSC-46F16]